MCSLKCRMLTVMMCDTAHSPARPSCTHATPTCAILLLVLLAYLFDSFEVAAARCLPNGIVGTAQRRLGNLYSVSFQWPVDP